MATGSSLVSLSACTVYRTGDPLHADLHSTVVLYRGYKIAHVEESSKLSFIEALIAQFEEKP
jgi:hypothetical protein